VSLPPNMNEFVKILAKIAPPFKWNIVDLEQAAVMMGKNPQYHQILFPDGVSSAKEYYEHMQDLEMAQLLSNHEKPTKIREKISLALKIRIIDLGYKKHINQNARLQIKDIPTKATWKTCDNIWKYAGDASTDFNYYSKRSILFYVYVRAVKCYAIDDSKDFTKTAQNIDYNINKVLNIAKIKTKFKAENIPILRLFF
jgi:ubiquinone biosynthesis protein COQ9